METKKTVKKSPPKTPEASVVEIEKGLVPLSKEAASIVIKTKEDYASASSFLAKVKGYINRVSELQTFFTEPYIEQRRVALVNKNNVEALFAPKLLPLTEMEKRIKRMMADFTIEEDRKVRVEEERLQKIRDVANAKREEAGKTMILEPVKSVERAEATVRSAEGKTTTKKVWKFEVIDTSVLFKDKAFAQQLHALCEQKLLHEQVLRAMVNAGTREVGGVRIYEDIEISVSAN